MGYHTDFAGNVSVDPPLNPHEVAYLEKFEDTRRMRRLYGPYFVDSASDGDRGQRRTDDIMDYNDPPEGQPGLWCGWVPAEDGSAIEWNEVEKFYHSAEWMAYLIDHFLKPGAVVQQQLADWPAEWPRPAEFEHFTFDHVVNGRIEAQGERHEDHWFLVVTDNEVTVEDFTDVAGSSESASGTVSNAVLDLELPPNDSGTTTVRAYLIALLALVWRDGEGFDGKRPFGNSSWEYDLYGPMVRAGMVPGRFDKWGGLDEFDRAAADELIANAIQSLSTT